MRSIRHFFSRFVRKRNTDHDIDTDQFGDSKTCDFEVQEICRQNVEDSPNDVTNQYDVQSLGNRDELIDCPDIVTDQSDDQSADDELIGDHETQLCVGSEADLHKHLKGCTKNPGHKEFIPVETFSLKHLPEGHHDNDLYEFIKATADLTVRVDVRMTSPDRPEVWPETNFPYPFYNMRKSTNLRLGSGKIYGVDKFTAGVDDKYGNKHLKNLRNCWCKNCQDSDSPSNVWWEFDVYTATHVVFDDIEASHTSLRLFYDREDSPVVSVDKVSVVNVNIEYDMCVLKCVTCDKNLGNKLEKMLEHYFDVWRKVLNKYKKSKDVVKLTFIVSHPHGCSKQVSVGHWKNKYQVGNVYKKFTYTTCTCPGSSGANVQCVGYPIGWFYAELVHSGSLKSGLNQSEGLLVSLSCVPCVLQCKQTTWSLFIDCYFLFIINLEIYSLFICTCINLFIFPLV